jgi:hypothetical protein
MIDQYFIPFETGLPTEMDALGFNETCMGCYNKTEFATYGGAGTLLPAGSLILLGTANREKLNPDYLPAPLFCQAQAWLREHHQMNLEPYPADSGDYVYSLSSTGPNNTKIWQDGNWPYFEALTKGLQKALEIIKKRRDDTGV